MAFEQKSVSTTEQADAATAVLRSIKDFTNLIEATRKEVKQPIIDIERKIDALAKELVTKLDGEATRISRNLGTWTDEQRRKQEEARRKAYDEEQRIIAETNAKLKEAEEKSRTAASLEKKVEKIETAAFVAIAETRQAAVSAAPVPVGLASRSNVCYEVTDIVALYEAQPVLVKLSPNDAAIKSALKQLRPEQTLPGIRWWRETKSHIR